MDEDAWMLVGIMKILEFLLVKKLFCDIVSQSVYHLC